MLQAVQPVRTLDDFRALLKTLPGPDHAARSRAVAHESNLIKPPGALGRLEDLMAWLCAWQGRQPPRLDYPTVVVFAGNHGVATLGVSAYPAAVTAQMVDNFRAGGAAVNQLCRTFGATLLVRAIDLERPTANFVHTPAMTEDECVAALLEGMAAVPAGSDVLCVGEMGIANTTVAATICHGLFGGAADTWTGPGTGIVGEQLAAKAQVVARAVSLHRPAWRDAVDVLRYVGGRELAAIAGAVIAARLKRVPVLLDGYVCTAAAAVLEAFTTGALDHCVIAHVSAEPAHRHLCDRLGKRPLLDLSLRLGEASGAALALALLQGAIACHNGMATFGDASVSGPCQNQNVP
ncbi:Nicotinate-nucleotide--dimethylbenzimidazole phosphoribosyltransferase [invertebrate metagenome]|uniref:Nicotinate-nucleotide--dimethylbenzimidazole phosphoribosyltransferase n=1 Tax=invertebrate metagenome TaxID=1711999 RepID=A0A484H680_9ZZZZ